MQGRFGVATVLCLCRLGRVTCGLLAVACEGEYCHETES